jgi:hypothetical protein
MKIENIDTTLEEIQDLGDQMRQVNEAVAQVGLESMACVGGGGKLHRYAVVIPSKPQPQPHPNLTSSQPATHPIIQPPNRPTIQPVGLFADMDEDALANELAELEQVRRLTVL